MPRSRSVGQSPPPLGCVSGIVHARAGVPCYFIAVDSVGWEQLPADVENAAHIPSAPQHSILGLRRPAVDVSMEPSLVRTIEEERQPNSPKRQMGPQLSLT